jgi:RimJ/RimL family protein N-acetyltransferase
MQKASRDQLNDFEALVMARLRARHWHVDMATEAMRIYGDPVAMRFLSPTYPLKDEAAMRANIERVIGLNATHAKPMGSWPLFDKDKDNLVGTVLLKPLPNSDRIEVGWHLARDVWGRGYATEAGRAALFHGFDNLGLNKIYAIVDPENTPSIRVTERLGMTHLGQTDEYHDRTLEFFCVERDALK